MNRKPCSALWSPILTAQEHSPDKQQEENKHNRFKAKTQTEMGPTVIQSGTRLLPEQKLSHCA